jgi:hypothetical protein
MRVARLFLMAAIWMKAFFRIFAQGFPIDFYCATSRRGQ